MCRGVQLGMCYRQLSLSAARRSTARIYSANCCASTCGHCGRHFRSCSVAIGANLVVLARRFSRPGAFFNSLLACVLAPQEISCAGLTIQSSRRGFATRLISGVRSHGHYG